MPTLEQDLKARRARYAALQKLPLTEEEKSRWACMMHATWQAIGGDAEQAMMDCRQRLTRSIIVEYVCDANRMMMFGGMTREEDEFLGVCYSRPAFQRWARGVLNY